MNDFVWFFLILNIFLFIFSLYFFGKVSYDLAKKKEAGVFKGFIGAFLFYLVMSTLWALGQNGIINFPTILFKIICALSFFGVLLNAFFFFMYVVNHYNYYNKKNVVVTILRLLPLATGFILLFISLWDGMIFTITDGSKVEEGKFFFILPLLAVIYVIVILKAAIVRLVKQKSSSARKECIDLTISVVFLAVWVGIDGIFKDVSIITIAIFAVLLFLFVNMQQASIYTDALTTMNNRRRLEEFLDTQMDTLSESSPLYLFLADIDYFKQINDRFGHAEGDAALVILSSIIKDVTNEYSGFGARLGGDEFVWVFRIPNPSNVNPPVLVDVIRDRVNERVKKENKPYEISVSVGSCRCTDPETSINTYLRRADEKLYEQKKIVHSQKKANRD